MELKNENGQLAFPEMCAQLLCMPDHLGYTQACYQFSRIVEGFDNRRRTARIDIRIEMLD